MSSFSRTNRTKTKHRPVIPRAVFRTVATYLTKPDEIVEVMNNTMVDMNSSLMFVTFFVGVLDLPTGHLHYCNAGHDAPLLLGTDVSELHCESNIPVGVMPQWTFVLEETTICPGTTIFLFTDGLTEAKNAVRAQFQMDRINNVARHFLSSKDQEPRQLIEQMTTSVREFVGEAEQSDDLTMMAIRYR